jgi:hypothetical protein
MGAGLGSLIDSSGQNSLLKLQQGTNTIGASLQNQSAQMQATALQGEAADVFQQAQVEASQATIQWKTAYGSQDETYAENGVEQTGSPLTVLNETRMQGEQNVSMIQQQGALQQSLLLTQANQAQLTGLSDILGAQGQNQIAAQQNQITQQQQETAILMQFLGMGIGLGGGILAGGGSSGPLGSFTSGLVSGITGGP